MTTLIAGGLGFIGVHTVEAFVSAGEPVVATYYESQRVPRFLTPYLGNGLTLEQCDIGNPGALETLARKHSVDGIVNLAIAVRHEACLFHLLPVNLNITGIVQRAIGENAHFKMNRLSLFFFLCLTVLGCLG